MLECRVWDVFCDFYLYARVRHSIIGSILSVLLDWRVDGKPRNVAWCWCDL